MKLGIGLGLTGVRGSARDPLQSLLSRAAVRIEAATGYTNTGTVSGVTVQNGSTSGADSNDTLLLVHDGTDYLYFPGTANNSVQIAKPGGVTTIKWTATKTDDTTSTGTTTADPVVVGGIELSGEVKKIELEDNDNQGVVLRRLQPSTGTIASDKSTITDDLSGTWTLNRSAPPSAQLTVVTRTGFLFGADDYLQLADDATWDLGTTGEGTLVVVAEHQATLPNVANRLFENRAVGMVSGVAMYVNDVPNAFFVVSDGTGSTVNANVSGVATNGLCFVATGRINATEVHMRVNGVVDATPGDRTSLGAINPTQAPRVGTVAISTAAPFSGLIYAVYWFPEELSDAEVALIESHYGVAA